MPGINVLLFGPAARRRKRIEIWSTSVSSTWIDSWQSSSANLGEDAERVLAENALYLLVRVAALHQPSCDVRQVTIVVEADHPIGHIVAILRPKSDLALNAAEHFGLHVVGHLVRPVGAERDVLPSDEVRDVVDVIEHRLDRGSSRR